MAEIDLDALRQARLEANPKAKPHSLKFDGKRFRLPRELPLTFGIALQKGEVEEALRVILDGQLDDFMALQPSMEDFADLANAAAQLYTGVSVPESGASGVSSSNTGTRSRPTSSGSTRST